MRRVPRLYTLRRFVGRVPSTTEYYRVHSEQWFGVGRTVTKESSRGLCLARGKTWAVLEYVMLDISHVAMQTINLCEEARTITFAAALII